MKAILEFELPEENDSHRDALAGWRYKAVISDLYAHIRSELKYNDKITTEKVTALEEIRNRLKELEDEYEINTY
jgi:hypothetical protein